MTPSSITKAITAVAVPGVALTVIAIYQPAAFVQVTEKVFHAIESVMDPPVEFEFRYRRGKQSSTL